MATLFLITYLTAHLIEPAGLCPMRNSAKNKMTKMWKLLDKLVYQAEAIVAEDMLAIDAILFTAIDVTRRNTVDNKGPHRLIVAILYALASKHVNMAGRTVLLDIIAVTSDYSNQTEFTASDLDSPHQHQVQIGFGSDDSFIGECRLPRAVVCTGLLL